jgi:hypothetical protein
MQIRKLNPSVIRQELSRFEDRHGMSSEDFYRRYLAGELPESLEFVDWAGLCHLAQRNGVLARSPAYT